MIEEDLPSPIPFVQDEEPEESSKNLCLDFNQNDISCPLQQDLPRRSSESPSSSDRNSPTFLDSSSSPPITRKRGNILSVIIQKWKPLLRREQQILKPALTFRCLLMNQLQNNTQNNHQHPELTYPPASNINNVEADSQPQPQRVSFSTMREDVEFWSSYLGKIKKTWKFGIYHPSLYWVIKFYQIIMSKVKTFLKYQLKVALIISFQGQNVM